MDINSLWEEHTRDEFVTRDVEGTLATMSETHMSTTFPS
jgi:hypothetical protein